MLSKPGEARQKTTPSQRRRKVVEENSDDVVRRLQRLPCNKVCADCQAKHPQCVNLNHGTFICMACSGVHREFSHKIKGIGHSSFTSEEVAHINQMGGNEAVNARFLAKYDPIRDRMKPPQDNADLHLLRAWIQKKYVEKTWCEPILEKGTASKPPSTSSRSKSTATATASVKEKNKPRVCSPTSNKHDTSDLFDFSSIASSSRPAADSSWDAFRNSVESQQPTFDFKADFDKMNDSLSVDIPITSAPMFPPPSLPPPQPASSVPVHFGTMHSLSQVPPDTFTSTSSVFHADFGNLPDQNKPSIPRDDQSFANFGQFHIHQQHQQPSHLVNNDQNPSLFHSNFGQSFVPNDPFTAKQNSDQIQNLQVHSQGVAMVNNRGVNFGEYTFTHQQASFPQYYQGHVMNQTSRFQEIAQNSGNMENIQMQGQQESHFKNQSLQQQRFGTLTDPPNANFDGVVSGSWNEQGGITTDHLTPQQLQTSSQQHSNSAFTSVQSLQSREVQLPVQTEKMTLEESNVKLNNASQVGDNLNEVQPRMQTNTITKVIPEGIDTKLAMTPNTFRPIEEDKKIVFDNFDSLSIYPPCDVMGRLETSIDSAKNSSTIKIPPLPAFHEGEKLFCTNGMEVYEATIIKVPSDVNMLPCYTIMVNARKGEADNNNFFVSNEKLISLNSHAVAPFSMMNGSTSTVKSSTCDLTTNKLHETIMMLQNLTAAQLVEVQQFIASLQSDTQDRSYVKILQPKNADTGTDLRLNQINAQSNNLMPMNEDNGVHGLMLQKQDFSAKANVSFPPLEQGNAKQNMDAATIDNQSSLGSITTYYSATPAHSHMVPSLSALPPVKKEGNPFDTY